MTEDRILRGCGLLLALLIAGFGFLISLLTVAWLLTIIPWS